jgi:ABC-type dipeptide/oligopeptide/nickel transport system permease subunit
MTRSTGQRGALAAATVVLVLLVAAGVFAPEHLPNADLSRRAVGPMEAPPFGTDPLGISLGWFAMQGAGVVAIPSAVAALLVMLLSTGAGLARSAGLGWFDVAVTAFGELVGALPRLVVVLVVATATSATYQGLLPIAVTWAVLAAPGAMDEAASTAGRLGGARFVEALRAHGFSATRIYLYHIVWLNLRPVLVRQGAEVLTQVVFLELAISYLVEVSRWKHLTHPDSTYSWAALLYHGYTWLVTPSTGMGHALVLGLLLIASVALMAQGFRVAGRGR